jgi:hypothetical protein
LNKVTLYVPAESIEAYRTAEVWKNFGTITAYVPSAIEALEAGSDFRIEPNPVADFFKVIKDFNAPLQVTVADLNGRTVLQQTIRGEESLFVGHLPKGVYFVRVNGKAFKIIKN